MIPACPGSINFFPSRKLGISRSILFLSIPFSSQNQIISFSLQDSKQALSFFRKTNSEIKASGTIISKHSFSRISGFSFLVWTKALIFSFILWTKDLIFDSYLLIRWCSGEGESLIFLDLVVLLLLSKLRSCLTFTFWHLSLFLFPHCNTNSDSLLLLLFPSFSIPATQTSHLILTQLQIQYTIHFSETENWPEDLRR